MECPVCGEVAAFSWLGSHKHPPRQTYEQPEIEEPWAYYLGIYSYD